MQKRKIHLLIGTAICAATMLLFLSFWNKLPSNIPLQITVDGSAGNVVPKPLFVFGMPVIFAVINFFKGLSLINKENAATYHFYIIPGIALLLSALTLITALHIG